MDRPSIICLTPVKNEAWILERFLQCASLWADHIIVADQGSDDGSREIAKKFSKVRLIDNTAKEFNEPERQKLLIAEARKLPGPKLLIALDADEFLTANFAASLDWALILRALPGTVINFQWACMLPDRKSYYVFPAEFPLGFVDDGSEHQGLEIHSPRLPVPENNPRISVRGIKVMHFSVIDADRFKSKVRWYQCLEFLKHRWDGRTLDLYRWYHRDFCIPESHRLPLPDAWVSGYGPGIDLLNIPKSEYYRWDAEILSLFSKHGAKTFRKLAIWDVDWAEMYAKIYRSAAPFNLRDPRSWIDRRIHAWLEKTQPYYSHFAPPLSRLDRQYHRFLRKLVRCFNW